SRHDRMTRTSRAIAISILRVVQVSTFLIFSFFKLGGLCTDLLSRSVLICHATRHYLVHRIISPRDCLITIRQTLIFDRGTFGALILGYLSGQMFQKTTENRRNGKDAPSFVEAWHRAKESDMLRNS